MSAGFYIGNEANSKIRCSELWYSLSLDSSATEPLQIGRLSASGVGGIDAMLLVLLLGGQFNSI